MRTEEHANGPNDNESPMIKGKTLLIPHEILADGTNTTRSF